MSRTGKWKTNYSEDFSYQSFDPASIPSKNEPIVFDKEMIDLLVNANKKIALLNGLSLRLPDMERFVSFCIRSEAVMSLQIDGLKITIDDILNSQIETNLGSDINDASNYIRATEYAVSKLRKTSLSNQLIKETHAILMADARWENMNPGEFMQSQILSDREGGTLQNTRYIPPNTEDMRNAMYLFEHYLQHEWIWTDYDVLIQSAFVHYQFKTISPFLCGNGRISRLIIYLFLIYRESLSFPILCISFFLKENYNEYNSTISDVRTKGDYELWIKFFLRAIDESATITISAIDKFIELHNHNVQLIRNLKRFPDTVLLLFGYLENNPIIEISQTAKALKLSYNTISNAVKTLVSLGVMIKTSDKQRNRTFSYEKYIDIFR
ncbi:MAG: Fic/DOC family N-terminal domain-containing protein [Oscillospiraceae bacterium]|nr:Fic/DOC family N-terminal domain-containing protein [Oscillospiraceae bacterium]